MYFFRAKLMIDIVDFRKQRGN